MNKIGLLVFLLISLNLKCTRNEDSNPHVEIMQTTSTITTIDTAEETNNSSSNGSMSEHETTLLNVVNAYRESGCTCGNTYFEPTDKLIWNSRLEKVARKHSQDMNNQKKLSHLSSIGFGPCQRIISEGYIYSFCGENIAEGYNTIESVVKGWINSPEHCKNIMNPDFKEMGIGQDGKYWTQNLGAQR